MKYLVIGAGGTGGCIGAYMTETGKEVTMIARGAHLAAMQTNGLRMETTKKGNYTVKPVTATDMEHYTEQPDVIFVCVKSYSLADAVPFIRKVAKNDDGCYSNPKYLRNRGKAPKRASGISCDGWLHLHSR
jgi:2-dehydropantoate 2-reductase